MELGKKFFDTEQFDGYVPLKDFYSSYDSKDEIGYGLYVILNDTKDLPQINKTRFNSSGIKINYSVGLDKLVTNPEVILIGLPNFMYSSKYKLHNEVYQFYGTGLRYPKRRFFGKLVFTIEDFSNLKVAFKKMGEKNARLYYQRYLSNHLEIYNTLPFANLSQKLPKKSYNLFG